MSIIYCDCFSGISGDMFLGALVDAGLPPDTLSGQLKKMPLPEFLNINIKKVQKCSQQATLLTFHLSSEKTTGHRHLGDIVDLIENSGLEPEIKRLSLQVFQRLGEAEASVHGSRLEDVHFHEVGASDSILDIVGAAIGLSYFNIEQVYSSPLPIGSGQISCEHGTLPLPAPATMALLCQAQALLKPSSATVELVTPTGAALLASLAIFEMPEMRLSRIGIGAGQRDMEWPNILRIYIGERNPASESHLEIETNIDDMNPQLLGHVMSRLFEKGALDVYFTPIQMKKNRPATKISVIAKACDEALLCNILLRETSTLGLRIKAIQRRETQREIRKINTSFGTIPVKLKIIDGAIVQAAPEFDVCMQLAEKNHLPTAYILQEATAASFAMIDSPQQ